MRRVPAASAAVSAFLLSATLACAPLASADESPSPTDVDGFTRTTLTAFPAGTTP